MSPLGAEGTSCDREASWTNSAQVSAAGEPATATPAGVLAPSRSAYLGLLEVDVLSGGEDDCRRPLEAY
jgi:hypothetical protein